MKNTNLPKDLNERSLMLWFMHRFSEEFEAKAILKGGMQLALLNSPRKTNDLDYIFVPYASKKEIEPTLKAIAEEIPGANIQVSQNSKNLCIEVRLKEVSLQIEASVASECKSQVMSTASLAKSLNVIPKPIRIMSLDVAFAHKLAAWNERRLFRDLYDCFFLFEVQGEVPDLDTLKSRLSRIESRVPKLKKIKELDIEFFLGAFEEELKGLKQTSLDAELSGILDAADLFGLEKRLKTSLHRLVSTIRRRLSQVA